MPAAISRSAKPMRPSPILRLPCTASWISSIGKVLASTTLSRKRTPSATVSRSAAQSRSPAPASQNVATCTEPSVHASQGSSGTSPQGLVASIAPSSGVGLWRLISSRKSRPGSPVSQAERTISSRMAAAFSVPRGSPLCGSVSVYGSPAFAAAMKASVTPTEILKRWAVSPSSLAWMNARTSGWSTRSTAMFAPSRLPPCVTSRETSS